MDVNAGRAPLAAQQSERSQHASIRDFNSSASPSRAVGFKETLKRCLKNLNDLVEKALEWSKLSRLAETHFDSIAKYMKGPLVRLRIWAADDIEVGDPNFGDSSPSELMKYMTSILEEILSAVEEVIKEMEIIRSLASEDSRAPSPDL